MSELLYRIALTKIQGIGAITAKQLVKRAGSATKVFQSSQKELLQMTGIVTTKQILNQSVMDWTNKELEFIDKNQIKVYFFDDEHFPNRLKTVHDAPFVLYGQGNMDLNVDRVVAIVGTRSPTTRGIEICESLVKGLKKYNPLIISGLAYGIDITAHRQAVEMGLQTVGVMGNGLRRIYPREHQKFTEQMLEMGGLLTEFPHDQDPEREHFPMRNRIIASLCDALVVVESARKGGSMISALYANDYHKDVFAIPGRVGDTYSAGCNHLIKTHKANILESAADISYILGWEEPMESGAETPGAVAKVAKSARKGVQPPLFTSHLTAPEQHVLDLLQTTESLSSDQLMKEIGVTYSQLAGILLSMELNGLIRALPGKRYTKGS
jgi:DNA processing protein